MHGLDQATVELIKSVCDEESVLFHKVVLQRMGRKNLVKVTVDTEAGITLGQCQMLSQKLSDMFFRKDVLQGNYQLEISSPGVEKALEFPYEYRRAVGRTLDVTYEHDGVVKHAQGELVFYDEIVMKLKSKEGEMEIPLSTIKRSHVKLQW